MQDCSIPIANAPEILQFCTKPPTYGLLCVACIIVLSDSVGLIHSFPRFYTDTEATANSKEITLNPKYTSAYNRAVLKVNSLWPSDAIWRQGSRSTLVQIMACCLTAPSHYLNQCWLIISKVEWHSSKGKFTRDTSAINHWNYLEN